MKKILLLTILILRSIISFSQIINIPDINLKKWVLIENDLNNDGEIQIEEAVKIHKISMPKPIECCNRKEQILSLDGISNFINLKHLELYNLDVKDLDFTSNQNLEVLILNNEVYYRLDTKICIKNNLNLKTLTLRYLYLTELELPQCISLEYLNLEGNQLTNLNLDKYTNLEFLNIGLNKLNNINLEKLINLKTLKCYTNELTNINLNNNIELTTLNCGGNWLYSLDISNLNKLKTLSCRFSGLTKLNLANNTLLDTLILDQNQLRKLDISQLKQLKYLNLKDNKVIDLDTKHLPDLTLINNYSNKNMTINNFDINKNQTFNFDKNMIWINKSKLFVSRYEVTNNDYKEFLNSIKNDTIAFFDKKNIIQNILPDGSIFGYHYKLSIEYFDFNNHLYDDFPIIGVNYNAAIIYCNWLTQKYGQGKYKFRLPTYDEFISYSKSDNSKIAGGWLNETNDNINYHFNHTVDINNFNNEDYNIDKKSSRKFKTYVNPHKKLYIKIFESNDTNGLNFIRNNKKFKEVDYIKNNKVFYFDEHKISFIDLDTVISYISSNSKLITKQKPEIINWGPCTYLDGYMFTAPQRFNLIMKKNKKLYRNKWYYFPFDKNGLMHIAGNVSELVNYENKNNPNLTKAMGGNYFSTLEECNFDSEIDIDKDFGSYLIGFRVVAEIIK